MFLDHSEKASQYVLNYTTPNANNEFRIINTIIGPSRMSEVDPPLYTHTPSLYRPMIIFAIPSETQSLFLIYLALSVRLRIPFCLWVNF